MRERPHRYREHHGQAMPLEEVQGLLLPPSRTGESLSNLFHFIISFFLLR